MAAITTMNAPAAATLLINGRVHVREVENNFWEIDQNNNVDGESYSGPCCCTMFEYIV